MGRVVTLVVVAWGLAPPIEAGQLESFRDPAAEALAQGAKVLVLVEASDPFAAKTYETALVEVLGRTGHVVPHAGQALLPPTRSYTEPEKDRIISELAPSAILRVVLKSTDDGPWNTIEALELSLERKADGVKLWLAKAKYSGDSQEDNADDLASDLVRDFRKNGLLPARRKDTRKK
jgi:hypothetical protein